MPTDIEELNKKGMRMDRYLWHVRLSKTRTLATQACQNGDVRIDEEKIKPSRTVFPGLDFTMKRHGGKRSYHVISLIDHRISAKQVEKHLEETTPKDVLETIRLSKEAPTLKRDRGMGRPTKKDLRMIEKLFS